MPHTSNTTAPGDAASPLHTRSHADLSARRGLIVAAFAAGVMLGGCRQSSPNPAHCYHGGGDQACAERDPALPFCVTPECGDAPYGCVAEQPDPSCYSPCGGGATVEQDNSCVEIGSDTGTSDESGSGSDPDMAPEDECRVNDDCQEEADYCYFGQCVPCNETADPDAACAVLTEGQASICLAGECVQCTEDDVDECTDAALLCDFDAHICVSCTSHDQCPGQAGCDLEFGACLPADAVWHVDGDGGQDFTTISQALDQLAGEDGTIIVHDFASTQTGYEESTVITGDRVVVIRGAPGERPLIFATGPGLAVSNSARLYARDLHVLGENAIEITTNARADVDSCMVGAKSGSRGILLDTGELQMRNSMLRSAGGLYPALEITGSSTVSLTYSTVVGLGTGVAIGCVDPVDITPGSSVRNSLIGNEGSEDAVACYELDYVNNAFEVGFGMGSNVEVGTLDLDWFVDAYFADLHLAGGAPIALATATLWLEGDPATDIDGDPRPTVPGSEDFAGADRPP